MTEPQLSGGGPRDGVLGGGMGDIEVERFHRLESASRRGSRKEAY